MRKSRTARDSPSRFQNPCTCPCPGQKPARRPGILRAHQLESFDGVPLLLSIHLDRRRPEPLKGRSRQRHHGETVKGGDAVVRLLVRSGIRRNEMNFVGAECGRNGVCGGEVTVVDGIESAAQDSDPHDSSGTSEESFLKMPCFNSSRPSPVTEEILISSIRCCLHHCCSLRTFAGSAASIFVATTIRGFSGRSGLCSASSFSMVLKSATGSRSSAGGDVDQMQQQARALDVAQELDPEAVAEMRAFDQAGNVGHDERPVLVHRRPRRDWAPAW